MNNKLFYINNIILFIKSITEITELKTIHMKEVQN